MFNGFSLDFLMEDYCYESSDKHVSTGYCSRFKCFSPLFVRSGKFKTHFSLNQCPVLELLI